MKSGGATSSCVCVLSDEVDLFSVLCSRFYCVRADDSQVQAISGKRSAIEMGTWTRDGSKDGWIPGSYGD